MGAEKLLQFKKSFSSEIAWSFNQILVSESSRELFVCVFVFLFLLSPTMLSEYIRYQFVLMLDY